ncbi:hypothetical protein BJ996_000284 [Streptomyces phaeogriseichromatogenes]|nr:hypothetical protein [Streptomyces murinus]
MGGYECHGLASRTRGRCHGARKGEQSWNGNLGGTSSSSCKNRILKAFYDGMADRPDTTFGTMNDDVLAHFDASFRRKDFVEIVRNNPWPE